MHYYSVTNQSHNHLKINSSFPFPLQARDILYSIMTFGTVNSIPLLTLTAQFNAKCAFL